MQVSTWNIHLYNKAHTCTFCRLYQFFSCRSYIYIYSCKALFLLLPVLLLLSIAYADAPTNACHYLATLPATRHDSKLLYLAHTPVIVSTNAAAYHSCSYCYNCCSIVNENTPTHAYQLLHLTCLYTYLHTFLCAYIHASFLY